MKTLITLFLAAAFTLQVQAGNGFDNLYSKYSGKENITTVNLTESMLKIASKFLDEDDAEAREVLSSIKSVKILVSEESMGEEFYKEAMSVIDAGGYEDLMRVQDEEDRVRIAVVEAGDIIKDLIIIAESVEEIALINVTGDIDVNKIGKALKALDINVDGLNLEDLEDLDEK